MTPQLNNDTPAWAKIRFALLEGSDWDTMASYVITERLKNLTFRLTLRRDWSEPLIVDGSIVNTQSIKDDTCGIEYLMTDENGEKFGHHIWVNYEDIIEIGIY